MKKRKNAVTNNTTRNFLTVLMLTVLLAPQFGAAMLNGSTDEYLDRIEALEERVSLAEDKIFQLEERVLLVEDKVSQLEDQNTDARLAAMETWKPYFETQLDEIMLIINSLKGWLSFNKYQEENFCAAINGECGTVQPGIICHGDQDCGQDAAEGTAYCSDGNLYQDYTRYHCADPGTPEAACSYEIRKELVQDCEYTCENAQCIASQSIVLFRTNAETGNYKKDTWIALDANNDGNLEGWKYTGSTGKIYTCGDGKSLEITTPQGHAVYFENNKGPYICVPTDNGFVLKRYRQFSSEAETSTTPIKEYAENNQETYTTGMRTWIEILDVINNPEDHVIAGNALLTIVRLKNKGIQTEDDIKVTVQIPELGVSASDYVDEIAPGDSTDSEELYMRIPLAAQAGEYRLLAKVLYDGGNAEAMKEKIITILDSDPR